MIRKVIQFIKAIRVVQKLGIKEVLELKRKAYRDSLTGVYNRFYFEEAGQREVERAKRYGVPFSVVIVDVDNLKLINDRFGHFVGDEVIKETAGLLERSCRRSDIVARWGGDEFVLLLSQTDERGARETINRLKELAQRSLLFPISLSCGFGTWQKGQSLNEMFYQADLLMYEEKKRLKK